MLSTDAGLKAGELHNQEMKLRRRCNLESVVFDT